MSSTRRTTASASFRASALALLALAACDAEPTGPAPVFPTSAASAWQEVRDCRRSVEHDLNQIRILASPDAVDAYELRDRPFPVGAVVLKLEYFDEACTELKGFTAMRKEAPGYHPEASDWLWQRVDLGRKVTVHGRDAGCLACHMACGHPEPAKADGVPGEGYDLTCAEP